LRERLVDLFAPGSRPRVPEATPKQEEALKPVRYISTRGEAAELSFADTLLTGLARDGGLYMPNSWPELTPEALRRLAGEPFAAVAAHILSAFAGEELPVEELAGLTAQAYAHFAHPAVTPLQQIDHGLWVLELFHGPTLAFKDLAMQLIARLLERLLAARGEQATIVAATSGDTGGAAVEAVRGSPRLSLVVLFPHGRISDVQRRMMTTPREGNVHAVAVTGTFDDCQALVKAMFNDLPFRDRMRLAAVNSINWGRIVAQISYYVVAATALGSPDRRVCFSVPTGNFGDVFAGYGAKAMGLPTGPLVIASNENDILVRAWNEGVYALAQTVATTSPSMDIQVSSNFERFLFEAAGRDAAFVRAKMQGLRQSRAIDLAAALPAYRREFLAHRVAVEEVAECIRRVKAESGYLLDPHSACGVVAARRAQGDGARATPYVALATAHPAKFPETMQAITGERPPLPPRLEALLAAPERITVLPNDLAAVQRFVAERACHTLGANA
jgi:threonine synthase